MITPVKSMGSRVFASIFFTGRRKCGHAFAVLVMESQMMVMYLLYDVRTDRAGLTYEDTDEQAPGCDSSTGARVRRNPNAAGALPISADVSLQTQNFCADENTHRTACNTSIPPGGSFSSAFLNVVHILQTAKEFHLADRVVGKCLFQRR